MFLHLLPGPVIARAKFTREYVVKQFWTSFVEDKFESDSAIQTKAEFSYAIAAMDRIGGWKEGHEQENSVCVCKIRCGHVDLQKSRRL